MNKTTIDDLIVYRRAALPHEDHPNYLSATVRVAHPLNQTEWLTFHCGGDPRDGESQDDLKLRLRRALLESIANA